MVSSGVFRGDARKGNSPVCGYRSPGAGLDSMVRSKFGERPAGTWIAHSTLTRRTFADEPTNRFPDLICKWGDCILLEESSDCGGAKCVGLSKIDILSGIAPTEHPILPAASSPDVPTEAATSRRVPLPLNVEATSNRLLCARPRSRRIVPSRGGRP